jgi:hypothetical protein
MCTLTRCSSRCVANRTCCGARLTSTARNSTFWYKSGATRPPPSAASSVLRSNLVPRKIVTDQLRSYPAAKAEIPEPVNVKHVFVKAAAQLNNRAENSHQPTRERKRRMRGFRNPKRTQKFLSCFGPIRQRFHRSSGTCCALHFIANNLLPALSLGANSPSSLKIRH